MKQVLNQLFEHQKLTRDQAKEVLINISQDKYNASQLAAFISVYLMRNISVEELSGFRDALLDLCIPVDFEDLPIIDLCGTGGDGKNALHRNRANYRQRQAPQPFLGGRIVLVQIPRDKWRKPISASARSPIPPCTKICGTDKERIGSKNLF